jgi:hypothetical protein
MWGLTKYVSRETIFSVQCSVISVQLELLTKD